VSPTRVVSLVPSITETLLTWGVVPVGVTRFCEQPDLPAVGGTKNPDLAAIAALAPDLVVLDREENRRPDAEALAGAGLRLHVTAVRSLADVGPTLDGLAAAVGVTGRPAARYDLGADPTSRPSRQAGGLRVFVPIWRRPWMSIGGRTYGSSLLEAAGAVNVLADAAEPYPTVTLDEVVARRPDLVLAPSEPYPFAERHAALFAAVAPMVTVDGKDLFWWGARSGGALERLGALVAELGAAGGRRLPG
jgi:ABC-type Fe3+-hydroxamate transport system substrate-binding protein